MSERVWFIADCHLQVDDPQAIDRVYQFLKRINPGSDTLYILGDFFEYWLGDDVLQSPHCAPLYPVIYELKALSHLGLVCYWMRGNRDFLLGQEFADHIGAELLLDEHAIVDIFSQPALVMHGDSLCTDDVAYQQWKTQFRSEANIRQLLAAPLQERLNLAKSMRKESQQSNANKDSAIMDVNQAAVESAMQTHDVDVLIHGHTHRQAKHEFIVDGIAKQRYVLGDWHQQPSFLMFDEEGGVEFC